MEGLPRLAKTRTVKTLGNNLESKFSRIQFTPDLLPNDITGTEIYLGEAAGRKFQFQPALVEMEEALAPAFIVERHSGDRCTVFIPSVPTPMAGAVYIIDNNRVHPLDLPAVSVMQCISRWGGGSDKLVVTCDAASSSITSLIKPTNQQQITNESV